MIVWRTTCCGMCSGLFMHRHKVQHERTQAYGVCIHIVMDGLEFIFLHIPLIECPE